MSNARKCGFVLLHGAGLGSWIWKEVSPYLDTSSLAIDLPGRCEISLPSNRTTLQQCADYVIDRIHESGFDEVILVAHSVSGGLALEVAHRLQGRVSSLVFVGAGVPQSGQAYADSLPLLSRCFLRLLYWFKPQGALPPPKIVQKALCNDLAPDLAEQVAQRMVVEIPDLFLGKVNWKGLSRKIRRTYVVLLEDRSDLSPRLQQTMARRLGCDQVVSLSTGHLPMLARPKELAALLHAEALAIEARTTV